MCQTSEVEIEEQKKIQVISKAAQIAVPPLPTPYKPPTEEEQREIDSRSVHVGNVDYNSTVPEIEAFFKGCGEIKRVTIPKDKFTKKQKNFAYVEFDSQNSANMALHMSRAEFRGRIVTVVPKRTNKPVWARPGANGRGAPKGAQKVVYVYVNGPKPKGNRRFAPY